MTLAILGIASVGAFSALFFLSGSSVAATQYNGTYQGQGDGSINDLDIEKIGNDRIRFSISTVGTDYDGIGGVCTGFIENEVAVIEGDIARWSDGEGCTLEMQFGRDLVDVRENACQVWHGLQCSFNARYQLQVETGTGAESQETTPSPAFNPDSQFMQSIIIVRPGILDFGEQLTVERFLQIYANLILDNGKKPIIEGWSQQDNVHTLHVVVKGNPVAFTFTHILSPPQSGEVSFLHPLDGLTSAQMFAVVMQILGTAQAQANPS